ncbi:MAG: acyloxyacyl hydrolase [Xanthomonadales bacterium]|nr:acyloxyacyl hydrolase [Xanthomonadales bacterium]
MKISVQLLCAMMLLSPGALSAEERKKSVFLDIGRSNANATRGHEELDIYRLGVQWDFKTTFWQSRDSKLSGYFEASVNRWDSRVDDVTAIAFSPVFVLEFKQASSGFRPYIEAGVGVALLSEKRAGGRGLGSSWQFEDRIGFGFASDKYDFHYRYMHYSNADIEKPNQGIDAHVIGVSISY